MKDYYVVFNVNVNGYCEMKVKANNVEEAKETARKELTNMDFSHNTFYGTYLSDYKMDSIFDDEDNLVEKEN